MKPIPVPETTELPFDPADEEQVSAFRQDNLGRSLVVACEVFERLVARRLETMGLIDGLSPAHIRTARSLDLQGNRMSELARRTGLSKQHIGTIVRDLQAAGIVGVGPDPADGRARIVRFTADGRAGLLVGLQAIARVVAMTEDRLGPERLAEFRRTLDELIGFWTEIAQTPQGG